jgi:hypothetical protein
MGMRIWKEFIFHHKMDKESLTGIILMITSIIQ